MPTYSDEVNVYNPNAIDDAIGEAATTASNYITTVDQTGIMVHPASDSTSGWKISSAIELLKNGVSYIKAWLAGTNNDVPTVQIGASANGNYVLIDDDSFDINHANTQMAHFGYGEGNAISGTTNAPYYTLGIRETTTTAYSSSSTYNVGAHVLHDGEEYVCSTKIATPEEWTQRHWREVFGNYSIAEGYQTTASGAYSHAEGSDTNAIGNGSHVEGFNTIASESGSHAEGDDTTASGWTSHAEGYQTTASGDFSHAEGRDTTASGWYSHAEGDNTIASGMRSHAEGSHTIASGMHSHAQNFHTTAASEDQTAIGKFNKVDSGGTYALIVGNGTSDSNRSNAFAVDWNGNVECGLVNDSGWQTLSPASGWALYGSSPIVYRKVNGIVEVRGSVKPTGTVTINDTARTIATLPEGYRPSGQDVLTLCQGSGVKIWLLTVGTSGAISASRARNMNSTSYQSVPNTDWFPFHVIFLAG